RLEILSPLRGFGVALSPHPHGPTPWATKLSPPTAAELSVVYCPLPAAYCFFTNAFSGSALQGSTAPCSERPRRSRMNCSASFSMSSPPTTQAFSVRRSPVLLSLAGSKKTLKGEPQLRGSPTALR